MNNSLENKKGLNYLSDARYLLAYASLEIMTERELKKMRYDYKRDRDKAMVLGIDVQNNQLPRTIKEKNLVCLLK